MHNNLNNFPNFHFQNKQLLYLHTHTHTHIYRHYWFSWFSGMGAATIFGAKQVQGIYTIFNFFSLYYIL